MKKFLFVCLMTVWFIVALIEYRKSCEYEMNCTVFNITDEYITILIESNGHLFDYQTTEKYNLGQKLIVRFYDGDTTTLIDDEIISVKKVDN